MKTITIDGIEYQLIPIATEAPKPVQWEPKLLDENEKFWSIGGTGIVFSSYNSSPSTDYERTSFGNYFHTEQEAEEAAKQVKQLLRLRAYVREFAPEWKADWSDDTQEKWFVMLNKDSEKWRANYDRFLCTPTTVYMPKEVAKGLVHKLSSGEVVL